MTKKPTEDGDAHVVYQPGVGCVCARCGAVQKIKFPCTIKKFAEVIDRFALKHINCKPKAAKP